MKMKRLLEELTRFRVTLVLAPSVPSLGWYYDTSRSVGEPGLWLIMALMVAAV
jgi:hypothetical protein